MLHLDGFEQYGNENPTTNALTRATYQVSGTWASVAGRGRTSRALAGPRATLSRKVAWTTDRFSTGFAASFTGRGSMAVLKIGAADLTFWLNPDTGLPNLNNVIGGALPTKERFYFYEIEVERSTGNCTLYINGRADCTFSFGVGNLPATEVEIILGFREPGEYRPGVTPLPTDNSVKTYDDFYVRDSARMGAIMITTRFPTLDVLTEWFKAGTQPSHSATVAQLPPDPLDTYIAADTVGKRDTFRSAEPLQNTNPVIATGIVVLARKSDTLNARLGVSMGGSITQRGETIAVESGWRTYFSCYERVESDTIEGIQNSDFGVKVEAP